MSKWCLNFFIMMVVAPIAFAAEVNCNQYKDANWIKECQQLQNDLNNKQTAEINSFDSSLKQDQAKFLNVTPEPSSLPPLQRIQPPTQQEQEQLKQELLPEGAKPVQQNRIKIFY